MSLDLSDRGRAIVSNAIPDFILFPFCLDYHWLLSIFTRTNNKYKISFYDPLSHNETARMNQAYQQAC